MKHLALLSAEHRVPARAQSTTEKMDTLNELTTVLSDLIEAIQATVEAVKGASA